MVSLFVVVLAAVLTVHKAEIEGGISLQIVEGDGEGEVIVGGGPEAALAAALAGVEAPGTGAPLLF